MKQSLFRVPRTALLLTLLGISSYAWNSFANVSKDQAPPNPKETLWLSQIQLVTQVPLSSPLQTSSSLNPDATLNQGGSGPQAIQQFQLSADGVLELITPQGSAAFGKIINPQLTIDHVVLLDGVTLRLNSGLQANVNLLSKGDPKEVSDTLAVSCTDAHGFKGTQDQINFMTSREDVYEINFTNGMGSFDVVRVVNQNPWRKLTECIRN